MECNIAFVSMIKHNHSMITVSRNEKRRLRYALIEITVPGTTNIDCESEG